MRAFLREVLGDPHVLHALLLAGQWLQTLGRNRNPEGAELKGIAVALQLFLKRLNDTTLGAGAVHQEAQSAGQQQQTAMQQQVATQQQSGQQREGALLTQRSQHLSAFLDGLDFNQERKAALLAAGYNAELWERRVYVHVRTSTSRLEEESRRKLVKLFGAHVGCCRRQEWRRYGGRG